MTRNLVPFSRGTRSLASLGMTARPKGSDDSAFRCHSEERSDEESGSLSKPLRGSFATIRTPHAARVHDPRPVPRCRRGAQDRVGRAARSHDELVRPPARRRLARGAPDRDRRSPGGQDRLPRLALPRGGSGGRCHREQPFLDAGRRRRRARRPRPDRPRDARRAAGDVRGAPARDARLRAGPDRGRRGRARDAPPPAPAGPASPRARCVRRDHERRHPVEGDGEGGGARDSGHSRERRAVQAPLR